MEVPGFSRLVPTTCKGRLEKMRDLNNTESTEVSAIKQMVIHPFWKFSIFGIAFLSLASCAIGSTYPPAQLQGKENSLADERERNLTNGKEENLSKEDEENPTTMAPSKVHSLLLRSAEELTGSKRKMSSRLQQDLSQIYRKIPPQSLQDIDAAMKISRESESAKDPYFEVALQILVARDFAGSKAINISPHFINGKSNMSLDQLSKLVWDSTREFIILKSFADRISGNREYFAPAWWNSVRLVVKEGEK